MAEPRVVDRQKVLYRFKLQQHKLTNHQIDAIATFERDTFILNRKRDLSLIHQAAQL
jgi:hypothetical protein